MLPEQGLHLNFLDLEKTIARRHWQCSGSACLAALPFDGIVQAAIKQAAEIGFTYTAHADDGQERIVHLSAHMNGFAEALQAIRDNPFGQNAPAHALAGQNQPPRHLAGAEEFQENKALPSNTDAVKSQLQSSKEATKHTVAKIRAKPHVSPHNQLERAPASPPGRTMREKIQNDMSTYQAAEPK